MIFDYQFRNYNFRALIYMILLSVLGILVVGSASNQDRSSVIKQIIGVVVSLIICLVLSLIDYHQYFRFTTLIYVVCAGMLAAVLLFGRTTKGATRWLRIGGIQIQPSEFVKIGLILILANFLSRNRDKINEPKTLGMTALICVLPVGMVYLQPNLSTTIVICFMILCMIYVAGISYKWIAVRWRLGYLDLRRLSICRCRDLSRFSRNTRHSVSWERFSTAAVNLRI